MPGHPPDTRPWTGRRPRAWVCPMARMLEADYLVVGAGAMGMAFTDALIDHAGVFL